jgi:hypothetical protein
VQQQRLDDIVAVRVHVRKVDRADRGTVGRERLAQLFDAVLARASVDPLLRIKALVDQHAVHRITAPSAHFIG